MKSIKQLKTITIFASIVFGAVLLVSCDDLFQDRISLAQKEPRSLDDLFRTEEKIEKLSPPTSLYISPYHSASEISIKWDDVYGAAYYMVERAVSEPVGSPTKWETPGEGDYEPIERIVYGNSYVDKILKDPVLDSPEYNNIYYYRVSAFNPIKKYEESEPCYPKSGSLFCTPSGLQASGGVSTEYIELRWEKTTGAESYEILRSDFSSGASATVLGKVLGNQNWYRNNVIIAEQGKDFYYMIYAVNRFGNKSLQTRPAYGYARVFGAPDKPSNVKLEDNSGRGHSKTEIKIKWDAAAETEAYYAVYRYSSVDSSLTRLTEKTEKTEWTDSVGLRTGVYYYYRIQAILDEEGTGRALKSEFSTDNPEGFILSPPDSVIAEKNSDGTVNIKWLPAIGSLTESLQYSYKVYSDTGTNGSFSNQINGSVSGSTTDSQGYVYLNNITPLNNHAFFRVSTVNTAGLESDKSIVVSPAPAAAIIIDASQRAFSFDAANASGVYPVKITWKKPEKETPMFYHVQRSTRSGTGFTKINENALSADGSGSGVFSYDPNTGVYTYIDKNESAKPGRKFYYRILSLNQLEQGNFPSDEKIGWGALTQTQYLIEYNKTMNAALKKLTYMYKSGSTDKLGTETKNGILGGTIYYNAALDGLGARIIIQLTNYQEFYIESGNPASGTYFTLSGNSNTKASMDSSGTMDGTVTCTGMYPGKVIYDKIQIKGGAAGGGTYGVEPEGFPRQEVDWKVIN